MPKKHFRFIVIIILIPKHFSYLNFDGAKVTIILEITKFPIHDDRARL